MDLKERTREIRRLTMQCIASIGVGHVGGCMSIAEALSVLYSKHMRVDPSDPKKEGRDRFVLSAVFLPQITSVQSFYTIFRQASSIEKEEVL